MRIINVSFLLLLLIVCVALAIDSAAVVNGIQTAGQVGQAVAQTSGHSEIAGIISVIATAACTIVSFIFGHSHGRSTERKITKK